MILLRGVDLSNLSCYNRSDGSHNKHTKQLDTQNANRGCSRLNFSLKAIIPIGLESVTIEQSSPMRQGA
jgi:hypothetical protein